MSWDSVDDIETRLGLDSLQIETRWGRDFLFLYRWALVRTRPSIQCVPDIQVGVKRPGRGVDHPPTSGAEVKERLDRYPTSTPPLSLRGLF